VAYSRHFFNSGLFELRWNYGNAITVSKLKAHLKKAAARTVEDLWELIGNRIDEFKPTECKNYFKATGYEQH